MTVADNFRAPGNNQIVICSLKKKLLAYRRYGFSSKSYLKRPFCKNGDSIK
ncbi:MAG: hypothetical protein JWN71_3925 [Xanthobacteraceae bacterium]|nr:hypothetical protein [Xanthobacteraceae bacterium]